MAPLEEGRECLYLRQLPRAGWMERRGITRSLHPACQGNPVMLLLPHELLHCAGIISRQCGILVPHTQQSRALSSFMWRRPSPTACWSPGVVLGGQHAEHDRDVDEGVVVGLHDEVRREEGHRVLEQQVHLDGTTNEMNKWITPIQPPGLMKVEVGEPSGAPSRASSTSKGSM